jgi:hypothetical protein
MPVADGDYRKRLGDKRRGLAKAKRERAFSSAPTGSITKGSSIKGLLSGLVVDAAEPLTKTLLNAFGGAVHGLSSAHGTSSLTDGTTDPRVGQYLGDTSTLGQRLTGTALEYAPVSEKVKADRRELWNAPATGSTVALATSDFMPDPLPPGAGVLAAGAVKRTLPKSIKLANLLDLGNLPKTPGNEANLGKLQQLVDQGIVRGLVAERFGEAGSFPVNVDAVRNLVSRAGLDEVPVIPQGAKRPKNTPSIQRVDVDEAKQVRDDGKLVFDEAGNPVMREPERRVGLFYPDGEAVSLTGAVLGASPIPGYKGGSFMGGSTLTSLLNDPKTIQAIRTNYGTAVKRTAEEFGPGGQGVLADEFYQTTAMVGEDMAKHYADRALPAGRQVTSDFVSDVGAMMSSGTKPEVQFAQQSAIIDLTTGGNSEITKRVGVATDALRALNETTFSTKAEANSALKAWKDEYLSGKGGLAVAVNDALRAQKLGTQRSKGNVTNVLSGSAHVVGDKSGGYRIAGHFGVPRAEHYGAADMSKTVMYGDAMNKPYRTSLWDVDSIVNDVWDDNIAGLLKYEPQVGFNYARKVGAAAQGFNDQALILAKRYKDMGMSDKEIARRLAGPSNQQQMLWDATRSHVAPAVISPIVQMFG